LATIQDVARQAKVSPATVSRVLNGKGTVDPALRQRVLAAVDALGYRRNAVARNLRRQRTTLWAAIVSDVGNPFFTSMVRGIEDVAQTLGYSVVLCNTDEDGRKEAEYIAVAESERMAGVIIVPASERATDVSPLVDAGTPVVAVDRRVRDSRVDTVIADNMDGAQQATAHLLESYERVACITGHRRATTATERLKGYERALRRAGREVDSSLVRVADFRQAGGREAMASLLAEPNPPDAVFVANNLMTVGALEALVEAGVDMPGEMGIVGFDDVPWASIVRPALSTVGQQTYEVGRVAGRLLGERIEQSGGTPSTIILPTTLRVRESSTRPRIEAEPAALGAAGV
jgi:LacI family transcriptional regulator